MSLNTRSHIDTTNAAAAEVASTKTTKTRRPHKKSHNGCTECKTRHIRCDERQPTCANCEVAERSCAYKAPQPGKQHPKKRRKTRQKQQPQSEASPSLAGSTPWPGTEADQEDAEESTLVLRPHDDQANLDNAGDRLPSSLPEGYALPALKNYDTEDHRTPAGPPSGLSNARTPSVMPLVSLFSRVRAASSFRQTVPFAASSQPLYLAKPLSLFRQIALSVSSDHSLSTSHHSLCLFKPHFFLLQPPLGSALHLSLFLNSASSTLLPLFVSIADICEGRKYTRPACRLLSWLLSAIRHHIRSGVHCTPHDPTASRACSAKLQRPERSEHCRHCYSSRRCSALST
jgi:hypothetical protein